MKTIILDIDSETVKILILFLSNGYEPSSKDKQKSLFEKSSEHTEMTLIVLA